MRFFRLVSAIDLLLVGAATMQAEKFWETDLCHILLIIDYYLLDFKRNVMIVKTFPGRYSPQILQETNS